MKIHKRIQQEIKAGTPRDQIEAKLKAEFPNKDFSRQISQYPTDERRKKSMGLIWTTVIILGITGFAKAVYLLIYGSALWKVPQNSDTFSTFFHDISHPLFQQTG